MADPAPTWFRRVCGEDVADVLDGDPELGSALRREEYSVRLRRAALGSWGRRGWRRRVAVESGLPAPARPSVSIALATRRPEMVAFALRQIEAQHDDDHEILLVCHGFDPAPIPPTSAPLTVIPAPATMAFGDVLNLAVSAASGDLVLKWDDDDWYSPNFITDLLLARDYSGAEIVGCQPEFTFLHELWLTTRRRGASELYRAPIAGGTMLMDRGFLRGIGGFRPTRRFVDAGVLEAAQQSSARVYRMHGLGYVLRRASSGHTWDPGLGHFIRRSVTAQQWRGFAPSREIVCDPQDRPTRRERS